MLHDGSRPEELFGPGQKSGLDRCDLAGVDAHLPREAEFGRTPGVALGLLRIFEPERHPVDRRDHAAEP